MKAFPAKILYEFCEQVFRKAGLTAAHAQIMADSLVDANLRGVDSHGVVRIPVYLDRLKSGAAKSCPEISVVAETPATALVDADCAMGQVASVYATDLAIRKAKKAGMGFVSIRNSEHFGAAAYYGLRAARQGLIGFAGSNTTAGMAAWGGAEPILGNNPFAIVAPAGEEYPNPIVVDMATSVVAWGKILIAKGKGEKIPTHWALDCHGAPTDDPEAALSGVLLPFGEHKGFGIALAVEILTGVLSGANFGKSVPHMYNDLDRPLYSGQFVAALDVEAFMPLATFKARLDEVVRQLHGSRPAKGFDRVYVPGEIEFERAEERRAAGIPLSDTVIGELSEKGRELGIPFPS
ncbi:MAG: Ldh family oxidoreductase [Bacteroidota bacterium]